MDLANVRARLRPLSPWLAVLALYALFEAPGIVIAEPLRPAADLAVLLCAYVASLSLPRFGRALRVALGVFAVVLAVYRVDRAVFMAFMQQEPQLYDQVFMVRLLVVLFADLWDARLALGLLSGVIGIVVLIALARALIRRVRSLAERPGPRRLGLVLSALLCAATLLGSSRSALAAHAPHWITPELIRNLAQSRELYASVQRQVRSSPYRSFDDVRLARRPDISMMLVESYGRAMLVRDELRGPWLARLHAMEQRLGAAGWHAVSGFSAAPVSGGRSWLAQGTLLMGIRVQYESVFHHLVSQIDRVPNLVSTLERQGYHSVQLAPSDRKRMGVEEVNYYGYDRQVRLDDLNYTGPKMGWGVVPDQYSLGFTEQHVLRQAPRPMFFIYHMVSSHAPWEAVPNLVGDYRKLNGSGRSTTKLRQGHAGEATLRRLRRYGHEPRAETRSLTDAMVAGYRDTILYDLELLERHLVDRRGDELVFILGDHQPPLVAGSGFDLATPVHILARDPALLQPFEHYGFTPGLRLDEHHPINLRHEGLYSMVVRALAQCCGQGGALPSYFPEGSPF